MPIFEDLLPVRQSFFLRLLGRLPASNALVEVNNLLAKAQQFRDISSDQIRSIEEKYKLSFPRKFAEASLALYRQAAQHLAADEVITPDEKLELKHLADLLSLPAEVSDPLNLQAAEAVFAERVKADFDAGKIDEKTRERLNKIAEALGLSEEQEQSVLARVLASWMSDWITTALSDKRWSPAEQERLDFILRSLNANPQVEGQTKHLIEKFGQYWRYENAPLTPIEGLEIRLQKNEACCWFESVDLYQTRTVTKTVRYAGPSVSFRICKGVYYRAGSYDLERITHDEQRHISSGTLYLTNKRIIYVSEKGTKTIRLSNVLSAVPYSNAIEIQPSSGKPLMFFASDDAEKRSILFSRMLQELE
ncbi:MAG: hypothetical protein AB7M05_20350 [Alphaproteobacteria bacterium]